MTRTMYDSINATSIPLDAEMVAGYGNGEFTWTAAAWARFPHARHVRIDVTGTDPAGCGVLDVERGDATPAAAGPWILARLGHGRAVIYCNLSTLPAVQSAARGLDYSLWLADWTGHAHQVGGAIAVQYRNTPGYDLSVVYDDSWHPG
jgi:hypothetical protein